MNDTSTPNWDPKAAERYAARIANIQQGIDKVKDEAAEKCAPFYDDIKAIKKEATDNGLPRREFNKFVSDRKKMAKIVSSYDKMSEEEQGNVDVMREAAGLVHIDEIREQLEFDFDGEVEAA